MSSLDHFLTGLVIGLGMSIVISICVLVIDDYYDELSYAYLQESIAQEVESRRLELEGFDNYE